MKMPFIFEVEMTILNHTQDFLGITSKWFNNQATSDLQIRLKNKNGDNDNNGVLHCHRLVLSSWSEVWAAALQDEKEACLALLSHDATTVEMCVRYCYTSSIELTEENVTKVHLFAHQYNLKALSVACEEMITRLLNEGLSVANCLGLYCYFLEHEFPNFPNALDFIKDFVCHEFPAVSKSSSFSRVPLQLLCHLLTEQGLNAHEDDVLDTCCRWLEASSVGSDPHVREQVLQLVRFPLLSARKLLEFQSHPLMSDSLTSRYLFALQWGMAQHLPDAEQAPLRIKLAEEHKTEILTLRVPTASLQIDSQILDRDMTKTLSSMLGGNRRRVARLLVNSNSNTTPEVFDNAVKGQGPFICIIKSDKGHVFGGYVEDNFGGPGGWIPGSPNNFLFSLKNIPPQRVVKLKRSPTTHGIHIAGGCGLHMGYSRVTYALVAFCSHSTADTSFELAPGYESVGSRTLHGQFGNYTPQFMEVFALPLPP